MRRMRCFRHTLRTPPGVWPRSWVVGGSYKKCLGRLIRLVARMYEYPFNEGAIITKSDTKTTIRWKTCRSDSSMLRHAHARGCRDGISSITDDARPSDLRSGDPHPAQETISPF